MWPEIISDALTAEIEKHDKPITGAQLRDAVKIEADKRGKDFPPDPDTSFQEFLSQFEDTVWIFPRPHQDFLVVPPERGELLAKIGDALFVRKDLFQAFTQVREHRSPWYDEELDSVRWLSEPPNEEDIDNLVPIPPSTMRSEISLRERFVELVSDESVQERLRKALEDARPFGAFSQIVHSTGLAGKWHAYRVARVLEQMKRWASEENIKWKEEWIQERESPERAITERSRSEAQNLEDAVASALAKLEEDELARISIPLDIVIKLLSNKS